MDHWQSVGTEERHGIVIQNFYEAAPFRLRLTFGERVIIKEKNGEWYLGYGATNRDGIGIFPKSYIYLKNHETDDLGLAKEGKPGFLEEVTSAIREWGKIWRKLYMERNFGFLRIKKMIDDLILCRSKLLSGLLSKYHLLEMKQIIISLIEDGNKLLGLDMLVRDENGDLLDPRSTPIIKMYKQHLLTTQKIRKSIHGPVKNGIEETSHYVHTLFVSILELICVMEEDLEIVLFLYDSQKEQPISENFVFFWRKDGEVSETDKLKLRVLFTDLASEDLKREQIYLACYVIKIGRKENRECELSNSIDLNDETDKNKYWNKTKRCKRRPFGVAALEIPSFLSEVVQQNEIPLFIPFLRLDQGDLASLLRKLILSKDNEKKYSTDQGLCVITKVFHGDIKEAYRTNQHLKLETTVTARKIGFPEVIFPNYVRNELYLTLVEGEFHRTGFSPDRNVEVTVCFCDENGIKMSDMISIGAGIEPLKEYRSVIYFHDKKPRWMETFRINIPYTNFNGGHLKFTFTHRPISNVAEKPFAMSYIRIMQDNEAPVFDGRHSLVVYKVEQSKWKDEDHKYLYLPSEMTDFSGTVNIKGFSFNRKDKFIIETNVCSTKLTQNVWLLNWMNRPDALQESLTALLNVDGSEIVKFLPDILDALFLIMVKDFYYQAYGNLVFSCLVYVFDMVSHEKYKHFQTTLDSYIQESFCSTLAFEKLISLLTKQYKNTNFSSKECLLKLVRSLKYFIKCIVKSKQLYDELNLESYEVEFEIPLKELLYIIAESLCHNEELNLNIQRELLNYLYPVYSEILDNFKEEMFHLASQDFCVIITELIKGHDPSHKISSILIAYDIIHSKLFILPHCRNILMPVIMEHMIQNLQNLVEVELCANCLSDILELIFELGVESSMECDTMITIIRTLIYTIVHQVRKSEIDGKMVALLIAVLGHKKIDFYQQCMNNFSDNKLLLVFLMEMLMFFEELVSRPVYSSDWYEMLLLQNSVILKTLKSISTIIGRKFLNPYESQIWNNYFHSTLAFVTQPCLQLEKFSEKKRLHVLMNYKDMRKEMAFEIKNLWFSLGQWKIEFIPDLVGPFLEITIIPDVDLQKATVPIFFDMAQCEFFSSEHLKTKRCRSKKPIVPNFQKFEKEFIDNIDRLVGGGKGEMSYMKLFYNNLHSLFEENSLIKEEGLKFVATAKYQFEWLLLYRKHSQDDNVENSIICTYELLNFYQQINNKEMYTWYISKLFDLHLECENYTEAAYTLDLFCELLDWSDEPVSLNLKSSQYHHCRTKFSFKENLYEDIITYLDKGRMWNSALSYCKELSMIYEEEAQDYLKLSNLLLKMSQFYDNIMNKTFPETEYFCVSYYGRGFPCFLQNKTFIHRWKMNEKWRDFCTHIQRQFPKADIIDEAATYEMRESSSQYLLIHKVYPIFNEKKYLNLPIDGQILRHLLESDVQKFYFSVPLKIEKSSELENSSEFQNSTHNKDFNMKLWRKRIICCTSVSFPGILKQVPVVSSESHQISPIKNFIDEIKRNNMSFYSILPFGVSAYSTINHICFKLNEIIEGSIINDSSFKLKSFLEDHCKHLDLFSKLKNLLMEQISLLQVFLSLLGNEVPDSLKRYMKNIQDISHEFSSAPDDQLCVDVEDHSCVVSEEKAIKDVQNNELSKRSAKMLMKSIKRKASFTRKLRLQSRTLSECQEGSSQWYIPPPLTANLPCKSPLSHMNFSYEMGRDSVFDMPSSVANSYSSLGCHTLPNFNDISSIDSSGHFIFRSKEDEELPLTDEIGSDGDLVYTFHSNSRTFDEDDGLSYISAISCKDFELLHNLDDEKENLAKIPNPEVKMVDDMPPPLPPKLRDYVNIDTIVGSSESSKNSSNRKMLSNKEDLEVIMKQKMDCDGQITEKIVVEDDDSSYESAKSFNEVLSISFSSHELGNLSSAKSVQIPEKKKSDETPPPLPPRRKRLYKQ